MSRIDLAGTSAAHSDTGFMLYKKFSVPAASFAALFFSAFCHAAETSYPLQDTPLSGGAGSVDQHDQNAYSLPQGNMPMTRRLDFSVGNSFFS
ncbi:hypothetical protein UMZ34_20965 [Halopseudomonas pachastrellae]|nr:hypothetical protein UMZ34_20965 [Halopseudomonas pachastrellae]